MARNVAVVRMKTIIEARVAKWDYSKFVKNIPLRVVFSFLLSVYGYPDDTPSLVFEQWESMIMMLEEK